MDDTIAFGEESYGSVSITPQTLTLSVKTEHKNSDLLFLWTQQHVQYGTNTKSLLMLLMDGRMPTMIETTNPCYLLMFVN